MVYDTVYLYTASVGSEKDLFTAAYKILVRKNNGRLPNHIKQKCTFYNSGITVRKLATIFNLRVPLISQK